MLINKIKFIYLYLISNLPFNNVRTKIMYRIVPLNIVVLSLLICGKLGDWWGDKMNNQLRSSVRFNIEQSVTKSAYIYHLTNLFFI